MLIKVQRLHDFYVRLLEAVGTPTSAAMTTAEVLVDADLRGLETHGAMRVPAYIRIAREGVLNAAAQPEILWTKSAVTLIDGHNGWGQVATMMAVDILKEKVKNTFVGAVGIRNTNHIGTCAYYARELAKSGIVSFITTNSPPNISPWGGRDPVLGTNPIAFGAPAPHGQTIVFDMATSVVAKGKILLAALNGESIPEGWALDSYGRPTTNAQEALKGTLLPVGGPKGYGLALFADIFSGVLTGSAIGTKLQSMYDEQLNVAGVGAFLFAIDVSVFDTEEVLARMGELIHMIQTSHPAENVDKIWLPGERSNQIAQQRRKEGIPMSESLLAQLNEVADMLGVAPLNH